MEEEKKYPVCRDLDGVYFRVERNGEWLNLCFSDLTKRERDIVTNGRSAEWLRELAFIMADVIRDIGDFFDIVNERKEDVVVTDG